MVVINHEGEVEIFSGKNRQGLVAILVQQRFLDMDEAPFLVLLLNPGFFYRVDKFQGAAVAKRHLLAVEFDQYIVDFKAVERGHNVLNGMDLNVVAADGGTAVE